MIGPMKKVLRELFALLWKALKVVLRQWFAKIMKKAVTYALIAGVLVVLLMVVLGRC